MCPALGWVRAGNQSRGQGPHPQRGDNRPGFSAQPHSVWAHRPSGSMSIFGQQKHFLPLAKKPIHHMSTLIHVYVSGISSDISLENHGITSGKFPSYPSNNRERQKDQKPRAVEGLSFQCLELLTHAGDALLVPASRSPWLMQGLGPAWPQNTHPGEGQRRQSRSGTWPVLLSLPHGAPPQA